MMRGPSDISCPDCGSTNLITISMAMGEGRVLFRTCPPCEARWWERDGSQISRDAALESVPHR
jgi:transposase-like protein